MGVIHERCIPVSYSHFYRKFYPEALKGGILLHYTTLHSIPNSSCMRTDSMRLTSYEQKAITATFKKYFQKDDHLWLFGSRMDPHRKGGDIDLYIETIEPDEKLTMQRQLSFLSALKLIIGEQKIDVIIKMADKNLTIYAEARSTGIQLV